MIPEVRDSDQESVFFAKATGGSYEDKVWKLLNLIYKDIFQVIEKTNMSSISFCRSSCISFKESSYILHRILEFGLNPPCINRALCPQPCKRY